MIDHAPPSAPNSVTSQAAADAIRPHASTLRQKVLEAIRAAGASGLTDEEGTASTGMNPSSYRPRRIELQKAGRICPCATRQTVSGRWATVWYAVGEKP